MEKVTSSPSNPPVLPKSIVKTEDQTAKKVTQTVKQEALPASPQLSQAKEIHKETLGLSNQPKRGQKVKEAVMAQLHQDSGAQTARARVISPLSLSRIDRSRLQQNTFQTLTRNIPDCQAMLTAHGREREVDTLCNLMQQADLHAIIAHYQRIPPDLLAKDALKGLSNHKISMEQFCSLSYLYALFAEFPGAPVSFQPLFDAQGRIHPLARSILSNSLYQIGEDNFFQLNEARELQESFFELMQARPTSEQLFFYIPLSSGDESIETVLYEGVGLKTSRCVIGDRQYRMVPSFSMMQAYVDGHGKENTLALCPTIGASVRADFRKNAAQNGREVFTPFPGYPAPKSADGLVCNNSLDFLFHDFYHILTCSQIPESLRQEAGRIADIVAHLEARSYSDPNKMAVPFFDAFYGRMVDMEFSLFRPVDRSRVEDLQHFTPSQLFLAVLDQLLFDDTPKRMLLKLETLTPLEKRTGLSEATQKQLRKWDALQGQLFVQSQEMLESGYPARIAKDVAFSEMLDLFVDEAPFKRFAKALYEDGILTRLHITLEELDAIQALGHPRLPYLPLTKLLKSMYLGQRQDSKLN